MSLPHLCTFAQVFLLLRRLLQKKKSVCSVRGGRLMISPVSHRRPEEINLSAHLGTSTPTSSCWLCHRSSRTPGMKNASRETLRLSRGFGENRLSEHVRCSDPEEICLRIKINKWPDFEVKKYLDFLASICCRCCCFYCVCASFTAAGPEDGLQENLAPLNRPLIW